MGIQMPIMNKILHTSPIIQKPACAPILHRATDDAAKYDRFCLFIIAGGIISAVFLTQIFIANTPISREI